MEKKLVRVTVYIDKEEHKILKSKLALKGLTISEWFRRLARAENE